MTFIQYWIPFVGFRDVPPDILLEISKTIEVDTTVEHSAFVASWLGYTIMFSLREK